MQLVICSKYILALKRDFQTACSCKRTLSRATVITWLFAQHSLFIVYLILSLRLGKIFNFEQLGRINFLLKRPILNIVLLKIFVTLVECHCMLMMLTVRCLETNIRCESHYLNRYLPATDAGYERLRISGIIILSCLCVVTYCFKIRVYLIFV